VCVFLSSSSERGGASQGGAHSGRMLLARRPHTHGAGRRRRRCRRRRARRENLSTPTLGGRAAHTPGRERRGAIRAETFANRDNNIADMDINERPRALIKSCSCKRRVLHAFFSFLSLGKVHVACACNQRARNASIADVVCAARPRLIARALPLSNMYALF
jgi:hypothetical protein